MACHDAARRALSPIPAQVLWVSLMVLGAARPGVSQETQRFGLDSVLSIDAFTGENVSSRPQIIVDISAAATLSDQVQIYARPWFRLPRPNTPAAPAPEWIRELWQAGIRYERASTRGGLATRIDFGYNVSPIGLGVSDARPSLNPTIATHLSYVSPMPTFDPSVPRVSAISSTYPLVAQLNVSSARWDARAALLNSAPTRVYALGRVTSPRQTPVFAGGGGYTPTIGLRLGVSFAAGHYATAAEVVGPQPTARSVSIIGGEAEYAFGFTKLSGEFVRSQFERTSGHAVAYEWFVQGLQTLAPRWYVAARHEGTAAPELITATFTGRRTSQTIFESTVGFRVTPEVTVRTSYFTRKPYASSAWDHQAAVSAIWARKWW